MTKTALAIGGTRQTLSGACEGAIALHASLGGAEIPGMEQARLRIVDFEELCRLAQWDDAASAKRPFL